MVLFGGDISVKNEIMASSFLAFTQNNPRAVKRFSSEL